MGEEADSACSEKNWKFMLEGSTAAGMESSEGLFAIDHGLPFGRKAFLFSSHEKYNQSHSRTPQSFISMMASDSELRIFM